MKYTLEEHNPADLTTNESTSGARVQRPLDKFHGNRIAKKFDPDFAGVVLVSRRDNGELHILDHQHVVYAALESGYKGTLPCKVYSGLSETEEAQMFRATNTAKAVSAVDDYRVALTAGDEISLELERLISKHGWEFSRGAGIGKITAIASAKSLLTKGPKPGHPRTQLLEDVLLTVTAAWGHKPEAVNGSLLKGIGIVYDRWGVKFRFKNSGRIDRQRMINVLGKVDPTNLVDDGRGRKKNQPGLSIAAAIAQEVEALYSSRMLRGVGARLDEKDESL